MPCPTRVTWTWLSANEGVADFNMAFEEDMPIRDRACSWDLAMDHDTESAAVPMTPAAGVQHPGQSASSVSFMQQVKGSAYSCILFTKDPEPSLFNTTTSSWEWIPSWRADHRQRFGG